MPDTTTLDIAGSFFNGPGLDVRRRISMGSDQPGDNTLLAKYEELKTHTYNTFLQHLTTEGQYYRLQYGQDVIPSEWRERGFKVTLPPTAYNAVQAAADHILTTPAVFVPERAVEDGMSSNRERVLADLKGQFLEYWWSRVATLQGDPVMHGKTNLIRDGKVVLKKTINFDLVDPKGTPVTGYFPWKLDLLSNYSVFEDPTSPQDPKWVFEAREMRRDGAMEQFPEASGAWKTKKKAHDLVRVLEYWEKPSGTSKGRRVMWIEDERVLNKVNPYHWVCKITDEGTDHYDGYVPYFIADSMWGDGDTSAPAHERYVGIIRYACSLIETESRQLTAADAQLRIGTFPIVLMHGIEEDDEQPTKVAPGVVLHIQNPETQKITILEWPKLDPGLFNMVGRVHQYANELAKFESLGGMPQRGVDTATEAQQNFMNASSKLAGPISGLRSLMMRVNASILADIEKVMEVEITLTGMANDMPGAITLDPDLIAGGWESYVELKTTDEMALNRANMQSAASVFQVFNAQGPNLDAEWAMTMAGIKNPKQRRARAKQEMMENDPRLYDLEFAEFLQGKGPYGSMVAMGIINKLAAGGVPGQEDSTTPTMPEPAAPAGAGGFPSVPGDPSVRSPESAGETMRQDMVAQASAQTGNY